MRPVQTSFRREDYSTLSCFANYNRGETSDPNQNSIARDSLRLTVVCVPIEFIADF